MSRWEPWLMKDGQRAARIIIPKDRECHSLDDVRRFFRTLPIYYPKLVDEHIEFEEIEDSPVRVFVPRSQGD